MVHEIYVIFSVKEPRHVFAIKCKTNKTLIHGHFLNVFISVSHWCAFKATIPARQLRKQTPKNLENNIIMIPEPHSQAPNMYPIEIL